jgi:hypothetical protein
MISLLTPDPRKELSVEGKLMQKLGVFPVVGIGFAPRQSDVGLVQTRDDVLKSRADRLGDMAEFDDIQSAFTRLVLADE